MRATTIQLAMVTVCLTGCGGNGADEALLKTTQQNVKALEIQLLKTNEGLDSCRSLIHQLEARIASSDFNVDQVPQIRNDLDGVKKSLARLDRVSDLWKGVSRNGDDLVVRGIGVADEAGNMRCRVSPLGLSIADANGKRVCEIKYEEKERAMSVLLRGRKRNSVALYAGEDRAMLGAYEAKAGGVVGWAATVTPDGQVTAGNAKR